MSQPDAIERDVMEYDVVTVGAGHFATSVEGQSVAVERVDWRPPMEGTAADLAAHPHVGALMWGAEDLVASMGGSSSRTPGGAYRSVVQHARATVLLAAAVDPGWSSVLWVLALFAISEPLMRPVLARTSSAASGLRFCGMIELPVVNASLSRMKP